MGGGGKELRAFTPPPAPLSLLKFWAVRTLSENLLLFVIMFVQKMQHLELKTPFWGNLGAK